MSVGKKKAAVDVTRELVVVAAGETNEATVGAALRVVTGRETHEAAVGAMRELVVVTRGEMHEAVVGE